MRYIINFQVKIEDNEIIRSSYTILEKDDDDIYKWYSGPDKISIIKDNNVSRLLKKFKI